MSRLHGRTCRDPLPETQTRNDLLIPLKDRRGRTAYQDVPLRVCTVGRGGKWNGAERKVSNMRRSCDKGVRIDNDKLRSETGPGKTIT